MIEPTLIALEVSAKSQLDDLAGIVSRRTPGFVPSDDTTVLDIYARVGEQTGHIVGGENTTLELRLQSAVRRADSRLALDIARYVVDIGRYRLMTSGAPEFAKVQSTTYQDEVRVDDGATIVVYTAVIRTEILHKASSGVVLGLVEEIDGHPLLPDPANVAGNIGHAIASLGDRAIVIGEPAAFVVGTVTAFYINAVAGDTIELINAADAVVSSEAAAVGAGKATFTTVPEGTYRVAINDGVAKTESKNTATVVAQPT